MSAYTRACRSSIENDRRSIANKKMANCRGSYSICVSSFFKKKKNINRWLSYTNNVPMGCCSLTSLIVLLHPLSNIKYYPHEPIHDDLWQKTAFQSENKCRRSPIPLLATLRLAIDYAVMNIAQTEYPKNHHSECLLGTEFEISYTFWQLSIRNQYLKMAAGYFYIISHLCIVLVDVDTSD